MQAQLHLTYHTHQTTTMAAEVAEQPSLSKVDSAVDDEAPASPADSKVKHRRTSSTVTGVFKIEDLGPCEVALITPLQG